MVSGGIDYTARIWSDEPAATEVDHVRRRAAVDLVQSLFETHMLKSKVLEALRSDHTLNKPLQALALEVAGRRSEDAQSLYETAWLTILRPAAPRELSLEALHRLEAACRMVTGDPERLAEYQHALSLALYRAGQPDEALQMVARLNDMPAAVPSSARILPIDLAVRAMASQKLGRFANARAALDQLRSLVQTGHWSTDQEALAFLREAEVLINAGH
jgi:hypothetical protein